MIEEIAFIAQLILILLPHSKLFPLCILFTYQLLVVYFKFSIRTSQPSNFLTQPLVLLLQNTDLFDLLRIVYWID